MNIKEVFQMSWPQAYIGKYQPTEATALQTRRLQDRSKYMGNGELRDEEEFVTFEEEEVETNE